MTQIILDTEGWGYFKKPLMKSGSQFMLIIPRDRIKDCENRSEVEIFVRATGKKIPLSGKRRGLFGRENAFSNPEFDRMEKELKELRAKNNPLTSEIESEFLGDEANKEEIPITSTGSNGNSL